MRKTSPAFFCRLLVSTALVACFTAGAGNPAFSLDNLATPTGESVAGGSVTFERPAQGRLNIDQSTDRAVINWERFDIGQKATTEIRQPGTSSLTVNRVVGRDADPTRILGTLRTRLRDANGNVTGKTGGAVMVLDRNGVLFGKGSVIDVGSIIVSTGEIANADLMDGDGRFSFTDFGDGAIEMHGKMTFAEAGVGAFVAPVVRNSGVIKARLGKVALASGDAVTIDLYGDRLVEIMIDDAGLDRVLENTGKITAEGGKIMMTVSQAENLVSGTINMTGVLDVSSVYEEGGKIVLAAGQINQSGEARANGKTIGGEVEVASRNYLLESKGRLKADSSHGNGGRIFVSGEEVVINGKLMSSGVTGGGDIEIRNAAQGNFTLGETGLVLTQANKSGAGGNITVTGGRQEGTDIAGKLISSGIDKGGKILLVSGNEFPSRGILRNTGQLLSVGKGPDGTGGEIAAELKAIEGVINADGKAGGGNIMISGIGIRVAEKALLSARATETGAGGDIHLRNSVRSGGISIDGKVNASGVDGGGKIILTTNLGGVNLSETGKLLARATGSGTGGKVGLSGFYGSQLDGLVDVSGYNGGGEVDFQGLLTGAAGVFRADALKAGDGGIIRLGYSFTPNHIISGKIFARGGTVSGDGGTVIIDPQTVIAPKAIIKVSAPNGEEGVILH